MEKTEITVQIFDDFINVANKLLKLGYTEKEVFTGEDTYFSTLKSEELKNADYKQLLNSSIIARSFLTKTKNERVSMLVFKKKLLDENQNVISEEKVSTKVDNIENAKRLLSLSGLENWVTLKQQNTFFRNGEIEIIAGTVEGLEGTFIEIEEYESISNLSPSQKFEKLKEFLESLGFRHGEDYSVKKVYMLYKNQNKKENLIEK